MANDPLVGAHEHLFTPNKAFEGVDAIVVDEAFWQAGAFGVETDGKRPMGLAIDAFVEAPLPDGWNMQLDGLRQRLGRALRASGPGGLKRAVLVAEELTGDDATAAIALEYWLKVDATMWPGMPLAERKQAAKVVGRNRDMHRRVAIWRAVRHLLDHPDIKISGRIRIAHQATDGSGNVLVVHVCGIRKITKKLANKPVLLLDATLPAVEILRAWFPDVVVTVQEEASMPLARIRYVTGAPTTAGKMKKPANIAAIRRYIIKRWIELGRRPIAVICQLALEERLKGTLPDGITVRHFNAIKGLDDLKNVRGLIVIGRTQPGPDICEAYASAISGREAASAKENAATGGTWFDRVVRGVRVKGKAEAVPVECDQHPDPMAEAVRWQICEAELIQAVGRARGVNRTVANPVDIDILADVVLPIEADEVVRWDAPSRAVEMLAEGVWLESPADMARLFPAVWETAEAAKQWRADAGISVSPSYREYILKHFDTEIGRRLTPARYRPRGRGQSWRAAHFDLSMIPEPKAWLEKRLGPLGGFEMDAPAAAPVHEAEPVTEVDRPEPQQPKPPLCRTDPIRQDAPDGITALLAEMHTLSNGATVQGRIAVSSWMARKPVPLAASAPTPRRDLDENGGLVMRCGWILPDGSFLAVSGPTNTPTDGPPDVLTIRQGPAGVLRADGAVAGGRASL